MAETGNDGTRWRQWPRRLRSLECLPVPDAWRQMIEQSGGNGSGPYRRDRPPSRSHARLMVDPGVRRQGRDAKVSDQARSHIVSQGPAPMPDVVVWASTRGFALQDHWLDRDCEVAFEAPGQTINEVVFLAPSLTVHKTCGRKQGSMIGLRDGIAGSSTYSSTIAEAVPTPPGRNALPRIRTSQTPRPVPRPRLRCLPPPTTAPLRSS